MKIVEPILGRALATALTDLGTIQEHLEIAEICAPCNMCCIDFTSPTNFRSILPSVSNRN